MSSRTRGSTGKRRQRGRPDSTPPRARPEFWDVDLSPEQFRRLGYRTVDQLTAYYASLRRRPILPRKSPSAIRDTFDEPLPRRGMAPSQVLDLWSRIVIPNSAHLGSPRFFGYVHGSGLQIATLADTLASGQNPNVADSRISPAESAIEAQVIRWLAAMIGYPATCGGLLVSGGMAANHTALQVALRARAPYDSARDGLQSKKRRGRFTVYVAEYEGHVTIPRAADLLNLGRDAVRPVPIREDFTMDVAALRKIVRADRSAGRIPFCVVGQAGTINAGALDPLEAIAKVCKAENLWFHLDAAVGAFGAALPELRPRYAGLARADSVTLDPHKWLYLPKECGGLLVKDEALLQRAFGMEAAYLERQDLRPTAPKNYRSLGPQSSRGFRALKVWMALKQLGVDGYCRLFRQNLACTAHLDRLVRGDPDFEAFHEPTLYIYSFRYAPRDLRGVREVPSLGAPTEPYLASLNRAIVEEANRGGEVFLTTTRLRETTALRVSICNHRTTIDDIERLFRLLKRTGRRVDLKLRGRGSPDAREVGASAARS